MPRNSKTRRGLILPPASAPHWVPDTSGSSLLYLGWGRRNYGLAPIAPRLHEGWTYTVICEGHPLARMGGRVVKTAPGMLLLTGPDVRAGWEAPASASCRVLVWLWAGAPLIPEPPPGHTWRTSRATPEILDTLERIHIDTRREIHAPDRLSAAALNGLRQQLDVAFARAASTDPCRDVERDTLRLRLAMQWMREHLNHRAAVAGLADYLAISPVSLQRLFRRHLGQSPGQTFHALKMEEARRRLALEEQSVKAVAFSLGYAQPGDFTRAYSRHFGHPPSQTPSTPG